MARAWTCKVTVRSPPRTCPTSSPLSYIREGDLPTVQELDRLGRHLLLESRTDAGAAGPTGRRRDVRPWL
ncbi:hypothetical protein Sru01_04320 [Sphaerisporangium rufum]|uniref:Uncharacterized protein n=1 Tax=Sphaerisporangium rufum TaxID=1381558 RepID=A0A919V2M9_9ACTN|nr:hypothetical protein Sru01_04320 [Sphaerisporangium rufum]